MSDPSRYTDDFTHRYDIATPTREDPTLVVCPRCGAKAVVIPAPEEEGADAVRAVCHGCGFAKTADGTVRWWRWGTKNPTDGYFGLDLWLQTRCAGHSLWAFSRGHLDLLEGYVRADHRERLPGEYGWRNASVASRLPGWMTSASNRETVLAGIERLREKL
jgi:ribosomal protein L37E